MKILQLIQAKQYRGAEIFCCQLSNHLLDLGHDVLVISIYGGSAILPFRNDVISLDRPKNKRYYDFNGWKKIAKIVSDFRPDVVQANAADTLKYAIFSKMLFRWDVLVVYRNASASSYYIGSYFSKYFNYFLLKKVNLIISVSEASKVDINRLFPFTALKTVVIPVGIEKQKIQIIQNQFDRNKVNLIHAGSFTREKNHYELIDIFKLLLNKSNRFNLHLIGDGDLKDDIEKKIFQENLKNEIFIHGGVNNPLSFIEAADILVLPSTIEGLPGVLLEAMFCRTPVIAYNVGGVNEIVFPETGILIEKGRKEEFVEAILKVSENNDKIKVQKAYEQVIRYYLNSELAKEFLKYYQQLIAINN